MILGGCNCGSVAYEIATDVSDLYVCHCSICRRHSGTNGMTLAVVDNSVFRWIRGEEQMTTWRKPDADWEVNFCRTCGSSLPGPNDATRTYVPVGSIIEGGENLRVRHHIWVDSKAAWDEICGSGKQHRGAFEG